MAARVAASVVLYQVFSKRVTSISMKIDSGVILLVFNMEAPE